ncbi:MAG: hypothetical protein EA417_07905 [Gammaproteobacteria bacterium]|nr:MAG: hypothetical protein EA417_07905 [Gammaproteobacteria bacterium]
MRRSSAGNSILLTVASICSAPNCATSEVMFSPIASSRGTNSSCTRCATALAVAASCTVASASPKSSKYATTISRCAVNALSGSLWAPDPQPTTASSTPITKP